MQTHSFREIVITGISKKLSRDVYRQKGSKLVISLTELFMDVVFPNRLIQNNIFWKLFNSNS